MKLRLTIVIASVGMLFGCTNLAVIPFTGAFPAIAAMHGSLNAAGEIRGEKLPLQQSWPKDIPPDVIRGDLRAYGEPVIDPVTGTIAGVSAGIPLVGNYETYSEVIVGRVQRNLTDDGEELRLLLRNSGVACSGKMFPPDDGWPIEWPLALRNCLNRVANGTVSCSDGRELAVRWRATECRSAYGSGFDRDGGTFVFRVMADDQQATAASNVLAAQLSPYPALPTPRQR
jgi:hypothetical protein